MYTKGINAITEALRAAEMRQGCTNHSHYAEILLNELGLPDMYEALKEDNRALSFLVEDISSSTPLLRATIQRKITAGEKALAKAEGK